MSLFCTTLYLLFSDIVATLVQWTFEGLTVEKAMKNVSILYHPVSIVFRRSCYAGAVDV